MKKLLIYILIVRTSLSLTLAQQNLVPNGSFETTNTEMIEFLNNYYHHISNQPARFPGSHFNLSDPLYSIFPHWTQLFNANNVDVSEMHGLIFSVVDGFYPSYNGTNNGVTLGSYVYSPLPVEIFSPSDHRVLLQDGIVPRGITLDLLPSGLLGFDCSPPDTKFAHNLNAQNGNNYLGLIDFKTSTLTAETKIVAKLESPLISGRKYRIEISVAEMNRIEELKDNLGLSETKKPKVKILVGDLNGSSNLVHSQTILENDVNSYNWDVKFNIFEASENSEYIVIRMNPINNNSIGSSKISGCFIDNVKLYEVCENPINQCNNSNYRGDMLDVDLKVTEYGDPLAYQNENQNNNDFLKTIKATHLDNVKRFEMKIYQGSTVVRTIDHWYPYNEYVWDGRDDGGNQLPEGTYKAVINGLSNDCEDYHITNHKQKTFQLKRKYKVFPNVGITSAIIPTANQGFVTVPRISGLEQVHWLNVKIYDLTGSLVFNQSYNNPAAEFLLSTSFGDYANNPELPSAQYKVILQMSNNCQNSSLGNNWDYYFEEWTNIGKYSNYNVADPSVFNWTSIPKSNFICPYVKNYADNYLAPRDCCEGNLYLNDVSINSSWTANILNDIIIGDNVVFEAGVNNTLYAGHEILITPGSQGVDISNAVQIFPSYNCAIYRLNNDSLVSDDSEDSEFFETDSHVLNSKKYKISPNPLTHGNRFFIENLHSQNMNDVINVLLIDIKGSVIKCHFREEGDSRLNVEPDIYLSSGCYTVKIITKDNCENLRLLVNR